MIKVKARITLVVSATKQIGVGEVYNFDDKEAKRLVELGFAEIVTPFNSETDNTGGKDNPLPETGKNPDKTGTAGTTTPKEKGWTNDTQSIPKSNK